MARLANFNQNEANIIHFDHTRWELIALGEMDELGSPPQNIEYTEGFKTSDWKKFQDALADHHYYVIRTLFPRYDFCLA